MRNRNSGAFLEVRAIAGTYVVTLAWDFVDEDSIPPDLLGFSIHRIQVSKEGTELPKVWLKGGKRFQGVGKPSKNGSRASTDKHPIQTFQWGDYTAEPGVHYRYTVIPACGQPGALDLRKDLQSEIEVSTEQEEGPKGKKGSLSHDVWFNRGASAIQAYEDQFPGLSPNENEPDSKQMQWLSRGLYKALIGFIEKASGKNASEYALHALLYEFQYRPVGIAFAKASAAGAVVDIRYEADGYVEKNEKMIASAGIENICTPQPLRQGIRHNKFVVLSHKGKPVAVWTGSTNISAGGIFGHSNVGHVVWDEKIAKQYFEYWEKVTDEKNTHAAVKKFCASNTPLSKIPPKKGVQVIFSPRDPKSDSVSPTMQWYVDLLASAKNIACITFAFDVDRIFTKLLNGEPVAQTYALLQKTSKELEVERKNNATIAVGSKLEKGSLENFSEERLTGFNSHHYIHDKFLLVDPLGSDPIVVTGTANFSEASQESNDENMLVIRGDLRIADIYFGEFMRLFDHIAARYRLKKRKQAKTNDPRAGYLRENREQWMDEHVSGSKSERRKAFMRE